MTNMEKSKKGVLMNIEGQNPEKSKIIVNFDEFELDDLSFKPLTRGLGFHDKKDQKEPRHTRTVATPVRPIEASKQKNLDEISSDNKEKIQNLNLAKKSGLDLFYNSDNKRLQAPQAPLQEKLIIKKKEKESSLTVNLLAWSIDFLFLLLLFSVLTLAFILLSGLKWSEFKGMFQYMEIKVALTLLGVFFYALYFSFLDLVGTPGKALFGICLISTVGDKLTLKQTLLRSFLCVGSFLMLGLPLLLGFHNKISNTKVVQ